MKSRKMRFTFSHAVIKSALAFSSSNSLGPEEKKENTNKKKMLPSLQSEIESDNKKTKF